MNVQRSLFTLIPRENYAALEINGLGTARKPSWASRTMQSFQLGHHFCQMCNFGEYKKRSEGFSTTPTPHKSAGDSAQPQEPPPSLPPSPHPGLLRAGKVTGSRPLEVGDGPDPRADRPASRSRRAPSRAKPHEVEPGQPSSLALGPAPRCCSPGAPHLPLEPHLSLSFLTCSKLSPVLSLTPKWPSTSSTVFV